MKLLLPFLVSLHIMLGQALQECPTSSGWSSADSICYRIVHFPESFWAAKAWCKAVQGDLLSLEHVHEVEAQVGKAMQGNAGDYRIDGWADGQWFHKENESLVSSDYELLSALDEKTLTVNLQDWQVTGDTEMGTRLGFICEGKAEDLSGTCTEGNAASEVTDEDAAADPSDTATGGQALQSLGCYAPADPERVDAGNSGLDPAACAAMCRQEFPDAPAVFATLWPVVDVTGALGGACFCLETPPSTRTDDQSRCNQKCVDNPDYADDFCGGPADYSVYKHVLGQN